jgi:PST family polysaccharide transporter
MISKNLTNKRLLAGNILSLSVLRGFQYLIPLITLPYLIKTIGIDNFGLVNYAASLGFYFSAFIQFGFGITATREIARHRKDHIKLGYIYSSTLTASLVLAAISVAVYMLIVLTFNKFTDNLNLYLFTIAFTVFQSLFPVWFFRGLEQMKYITFLSLGSSLFQLIGIFLLVRQQGDFIFVPMIQAVTSMIALAFSLVLIRTHFRISFALPRRADLQTVYYEGRHAFASQFFPSLYNNSAVFLLGLFTNNSATGLFTAITRIIDAIISISYVLSSAFFPYLSRNFSGYKAFEKIMLGLGLALALLTYMYANSIALILLSSPSSSGVNYIKLLSITVFFAFGYLTYNTNNLMLNGQEKIARNISVYVSLSAFVLSLFLIYFFSVLGAVISLLYARCALSLLSFYYSRRS